MWDGTDILQWYQHAVCQFHILLRVFDHGGALRRSVWVREKHFGVSNGAPEYGSFQTVCTLVCSNLTSDFERWLTFEALILGLLVVVTARMTWRMLALWSRSTSTFRGYLIRSHHLSRIGMWDCECDGMCRVCYTYLLAYFAKGDWSSVTSQ